jgi:O-succinylbenzoate synthase
MSRVRAIELRLVQLPLVRPFRTSFGTETAKECVLVKVKTDGSEGWGEAVTSPDPGFSEEWNEGLWVVIRDWLGPALLGAPDARADRLDSVFGGVRGNPMAKAALINAVLDAELRASGVSLASHLGATRDRVECGVSVGIAATTDELLSQVDGYLSEGYRRIKLKIEPGIDVERVAAVRSAHPDIPLSVDANAAYTRSNFPMELDGFGLLMIEQPLRAGDLWEHLKLQERLSTPVCLDESIRSAADAEAAIEMKACRIVNIKQGRVGGLPEAKRVHDVALSLGVPVWCGGMLETGIGRATNLALAALENFTLPGDTSASSRYFQDDITEPFLMSPDGTMAVPDGPGIGVIPRADRLKECTVRSEVLES